MIEIVKYSLRGLLAAMLPSPERERYARERAVNAPRWSMAIGLLQFVSGALSFVVLGLMFAQGGVSSVPIDARGLTLQSWQGVGMIHWIGWFFYPASWPFSYLAATGLVRVIAFVATREAVGEPILLAVMRVVQTKRVRRADRDFKQRLGPPRPDRIVREGRRELVVLSSREKPDWTEAVTIRYEDRYYKCLDAALQADGDWEIIAYRLREEPPGAIIRRLVRYDGPGEPRPGPARSRP